MSDSKGYTQPAKGIEDMLDLLDKSRKFRVNELRKGEYSVEFEDRRPSQANDGYDNLELVAIYRDGEWEYGVSGVYNYGSDFAPIDMKRLAELVQFCRGLSGDAE